ncbi:MAG: hypothetical protein ACK5O8_09205 [Pirellula sp.]
MSKLPISDEVSATTEGAVIETVSIEVLVPFMVRRRHYLAQ